MGQNHYIKPGQVLGTFNLDSGSLHVRQEDSKRPISSKLNIIFVPAPMDNIDIRK
ncbi:CG12481 [Drosophila busckii]|uniref:CG12481 n=2 Tax=Drosophila busckii TaxID=30019 RepID=A0A0M3QZR9_DROBS|nr:CG12481 [Drosophila busckii]